MLFYVFSVKHPLYTALIYVFSVRHAIYAALFYVFSGRHALYAALFYAVFILLCHDTALNSVLISLYSSCSSLHQFCQNIAPIQQ